MNQIQNTAKNIKKLEIQGARAIAVASLNSVKKFAKQTSNKSNNIFISELKQGIKLLNNARPTEPLNQNCLNFVNNQIKIYHTSDLKSLKNCVIDSVNFLLNSLINIRASIHNNGIKIIKNNQNIFTHCHSSTVEAILVGAHKHKKRFKVFNTETRPRFQGRITAKNLRKNKIPVTMVGDSAASFLISETSGKDLMMDIVLLGADALLPNGSAINKIGSYGIALSAFANKIPVYIVSNLLKYDLDGIIPIEIRAEEEIWPQKPKGLKIINFAFDTIPAKYITGIICEFGIVKPNQIQKLVKTNYPWLK